MGSSYVKIGDVGIKYDFVGGMFERMEVDVGKCCRVFTREGRETRLVAHSDEFNKELVGRLDEVRRGVMVQLPDYAAKAFEESLDEVSLSLGLFD